MNLNYRWEFILHHVRIGIPHHQIERKNIRKHDEKIINLALWYVKSADSPLRGSQKGDPERIFGF